MFKNTLKLSFLLLSIITTSWSTKPSQNSQAFNRFLSDIDQSEQENTCNSKEYEVRENLYQSCISNCDCTGKRTCNSNLKCENFIEDDEEDEKNPCNSKEYEMQENLSQSCISDCDCTGTRTCGSNLKCGIPEDEMKCKSTIDIIMTCICVSFGVSLVIMVL